MKLKTILTNMYWKKKYNTLENKYTTERDDRKILKDKIIELQDKYISTLEKATYLDKDLKEVKKIINERKK